MTDWRWPHFTPDEIKCRCGCGADKMQAATLDRLERARQIACRPLQIVSAVRCKTHNARAGGKPNSAHLTGFAVDIVAISSDTRFLILDALLKAGFQRIGIAKSFIHADDDPSLPQRVIWLY